MIVLSRGINGCNGIELCPQANVKVQLHCEVHADGPTIASEPTAKEEGGVVRMRWREDIPWSPAPRQGSPQSGCGGCLTSSRHDNVDRLPFVGL